MKNLEEGQEVTINMPFLYDIGDMGYYTNKILNTIEDCMDEVRAEIDENNFNSSNVCLTNTIPTKLTDTEQLKAKHEKIRTILIENGNDEFGDCIIDEICEVVGILPTTEYYEE